MPSDLFDRLEAIAYKASLLALKYEETAAQRDDARLLAAERERELERSRTEVRDLRRRLSYLEAALTLSPSREEVGRTREILQGFVREIDRCIADLTSTPLPVDTTPKS